MSLGELRRSLRGGMVVPFPRDSELAAQVLSCGPAGAGDYRAAWVFAALSHFLAANQGLVTQQFCKRQLRLSACSVDGARELVEQFVAQVVVVREEVLIVLQPGAVSTEFPLWNDRIRVFIANQARLLPVGGVGESPFGGNGSADESADAASARPGALPVVQGWAAAPAGVAEAAAAEAGGHTRVVRQRVEATSPWTGAGVVAAASVAPMHPPDGLAAGGATWGAAPFAAPNAPPAVGGPTRSGASGGAAVAGARMLYSGGQAHPPVSHVSTGGAPNGADGHTQGLDWSWPPVDPGDRAMAEIAFDMQMGVPRGGWCVTLLRRVWKALGACILTLRVRLFPV